MEPPLELEFSPTYTPTASYSHAADPCASQDIAGALAALEAKIFERRSVLGDIMRTHGDKILYDYTADFLDVNPSALDARKHELIGIVQELLAERLGADTASRVADQLRRVPLVSTADHHAVVDHPFWVNANLISALPYASRPDLDLRYLVVFSFAGVSLNNASGYPRGLLFHGGVDGSQNLIRLPFFPDKTKMSVVYGTPPVGQTELEIAEQSLAKHGAEGHLSLGRGDEIRQILESTFTTPEMQAAPSFSAQITKANHALWSSYFHPVRRNRFLGSGATPLPELIYLEIETIVTTVLRRLHLRNESSLLHRVLFDAAFRSQALAAFDGIHGGYSSAEGWGTVLFWGVDTKRRRVQLQLAGNELVSADGLIRVPLTPTAIEAALERGVIYPNMLLCYLTVALYYGMKCLGGFCQVHDLTETKQGWTQVLRSMGEHDEARAVEPVQTKELGGDGMVLAYARTAGGDLVPATGIDLLLDDRDTSFDKYLARSKTVTLREMMQPMLPEMYTVLYSSDERDPALAGVSPEEIMRGTGLQAKLLRQIQSESQVQ